MLQLPLWITYAWQDSIEGDFDYLVQQLYQARIPALYDKVALVPGRRLWDQIAQKISGEPLSGWAYLITPKSLSREACKEELAYALQRALEVKGGEFPLIGLLHQVSIRDVPLPLRVRLCINLANPDWIEEVRAATLGRPPHRTTQSQSSIVIKLHRTYLGSPDNVAVEFRPRFGELTYWRISYPANGPQPIRWGSGPANGGGISSEKRDYLDLRKVVLEGEEMNLVGCGNMLSPSTSAYVVFKGCLPQKLFFGLSKEAFSTDMRGQIFDVQDWGVL
ncbi:MAG: TIR domain-containing protein [Chloroflexota bacterium]